MRILLAATALITLAKAQSYPKVQVPYEYELIAYREINEHPQDTGFVPFTQTIDRASASLNKTITLVYREDIDGEMDLL